MRKAFGRLMGALLACALAVGLAAAFPAEVDAYPSINYALEGAYDVPSGSEVELFFEIYAWGHAAKTTWQVKRPGDSNWADLPQSDIRREDMGNNIFRETLTLYNVQFDTHDGNLYRSTIVDLVDGESVTTSEAEVTVLMEPVEITGQPISSTAEEGGSATFSVTATGVPLYYQWYVLPPGDYPPDELEDYWEEIDGATGATLTLAGVTGGMSGNQYYCYIYQAGDSSADSEAVTLTVTPATQSASSSSSSSEKEAPQTGDGSSPDVWAFAFAAAALVLAGGLAAKKRAENRP